MALLVYHGFKKDDSLTVTIAVTNVAALIASLKLCSEAWTVTVAVSAAARSSGDAYVVTVNMV